ncbi:MAG: transcriptional regulator [Bacteroidetes bacterium]|nr:transcriptional regulator [Bacteroidota bacterium]
MDAEPILPFFTAVPPGDLARFLEITFTEKELAQVGERWRIFAGLRQGLSQREVAAQTGCGIATVTRGARAYRLHTDFINRILDTLESPHA